MEPEAKVNLALKATRAYPDSSMIELKTISEIGNASVENFKVPLDATHTYRLFENEKNTINWIVYTKDLSCFQYCILDTLASGSLILNPQKFETLNAAIDY
jgi:hypothetical protein